MKFWCPGCGCPMKSTSTPNPDGSSEIVVDGCHCGPNGTSSVKPTKAKRTADCPPPLS